MASTINATTNGIVTIGDSVATLSLQTGGNTAVAIDTAQIVTLSKSLALLGSTSGSVTLAAPAVAGSTTLTLPATSGTLLQSGTAVTVAQGGTGQTTYTDGQLLIGNSTGNTLTKATLTAGTNVTITNSAGGITIAAAGGGSAATPTALGTVYGSTNLTSSIPFYNTCIGYNAGLNLGSGGAANIIIGESAGLNKTGGNQSMYIGYSNGSSASATGEMVINASGNFVVGKGGQTGFIVAGNTPGGIYQGNNSASWTTTSDRRLKKNIVDNNVGLDAINAVRVRNFEYRLTGEVEELDANCAILKEGIQLGVIAQELQAVLPDCVKQESTGVLSVDPDNLTWYMVNAIKQLSAALDAANARIAALEAK